MSAFNINTAKKEDVSVRLKQHNVKRAKDETKKLETESRKMEEKLKELRMAMNREKEERENQGGGFWSRGQTGKLNSYATDVLNKPTKSSKDPSKRKVKVLKDSPLDIPERSSQPGTFGHLAKQSINTPREKIKGPKCGQCEEKRAMVSCVQCSEAYCAQCFAAFHLKGALKKHRSVPLSASGPRQCMSPRPTPPPSNREYQNGYQSAEGAVNLHTMNIHQRDRNSPEGASGSFDGPSLLDGTYDESENAVAFQQALQAWRTGEASSETTSKPKTITPRRHSPRKTPRDNVEHMDHSTGTNDKSPELDIKFTNSLSYAERLLLKKHRRTDLDELPTPRLDSNATTPRTYKTDSTTPRIQSFPERENSFDSDTSYERVEFRALYEAATSKQPLKLARHDEDNISIIEIQNDERSDNIEETTACNVQEADDSDMWAIKSQRTTDFSLRSQNADDSKPPHFPKSARSKSGKNLKYNEHNDQNVEMEVPSRQKSSINNLQNLETVKSSASAPIIDRVPSASGKGTNSFETGNRVSSAKQRPPSSRPVSRAKTSQSRPGSRAKSRASSRLNGESHLTMEPSNALKQIASLPLDDNVPSYTSGLGDFLMAGVKPAEQERTMTPSKHKKSGQEKFKLSYTFYSMSPRSWKPDKSLSDAVPSETIQPIETPRLAEPEDPLALLEAKNSTEVHGLGSAKGRNMLSEYSAQYEEENETKKVVDGNISPASTTRSLSRVDTWLRDTTLPEMPLESSQSTQQNKSEDITPRPSSKQNKSPRPGSKTPRTQRPESKSSKTPRPESQRTSVPTSQTSKTPRQTSKTPRPLSRLRSSHAEDGRLSRAIVVDGDNLSKFDEVGAREKSNIEDVETLDKLEWELASQSGRVTADGQISRLSVLEDDQNSTGSLDSHRSFSRMSQQDQGYDINIRLRVNELSDDINTDNEHDVDEMDTSGIFFVGPRISNHSRSYCIVPTAVFTTNKNLIESISVESGISDHEAVIVDIKTKVKLTKKKPRKTFLYSKGNIPAIKTRLKDEFPEYIKKTNDQSIEICWETFKTLLTSLMDEHIPQKTCTSRWNIPVRKQRLYNRAKKTKKDKDWVKFKNIRRNIKNLLEVEHKNYLSNLLEIKDETNTESPKQGITKQFWRYVKSRKQESSGVSTLNVDGQIKEDNTSKAEALNNQFQSVFTEEDMASFPNMGPKYLMTPARMTRQFHQRRFVRLGSSSEQRKHSFFVRTITNWNELPPSLLDIDDYEAFKTNLIAHRYQTMSDKDDQDISAKLLAEKELDQHPGSPSTEDDLVDDDEEIDSLLDIECQLESTVDLSQYRKHQGLKKYRNSVKYLKPIRFEKSPKDEIPEGTAGLLSLLTYAWLTPIIWKLYKKGEGFLAHMRCSDIDRAEINGERLEKLWMEELAKKGPDKASFSRVIWRATRTRVIIGALTIMLSVTFSFAAPAFVMRQLLTDLSKGNMSLGYGMLLVAAISGMEFCRSMLFAIGWVLNYKTGVRMRGGALSLLYKKILKLRGLKDKTVGELVNICSNDGQRLFDACAIGPLLFGGPVVLIYGTIYTAFLIGPWALVGSATFLAFYPFMGFISRITTRLRRKCIAITDKRVQRMTELLNCIKLIKMYAWEKPFAKKISEIRKHERGYLERTAFVQSVSQSIAPMVPIVSGIFVITAHVMTGNDITATQAFTLVAIFNAMRFSLGVIPFAIKALSEVRVSLDRCKSVLLMEEIKEFPTKISNPNHMVVMKNASFVWDVDRANIEIIKDGRIDIEIKVNAPNGKDMSSKQSIDEKQKLQEDTDDNQSSSSPDQTLCDIDFTLEKGKIIGVCGSVGSGKSSLISSILGRMTLVEGRIGVSGSLAYVSQQAWIMNATVKENILFEELYDEKKYNDVIHACCLQEDLESFVSGSETEIGEKGINMSGGQKQRISLARALYANKDVYLLDDPLSAVDIHVGRHIFTEYLTKALKGKTVIFVTHQLQYLSQCDGIIVLSNGRITERGKHDELMAGNGEYSNLITTYYTQDDNKDVDDDIRERINSIPGSPQPVTTVRQRTFSDSSQKSGFQKPGFHQQASVMSATNDKEEMKKAGKLMVAEEMGKGKVTFRTYWDYIQAAGGVLISCLAVLMFILNIGIQTGSSWWLSYWLDQGGGNITIPFVGNLSNTTNITTVTVLSSNIRDNPDMNFYVTVYGLSVIAIVFLMLLRATIFMKVTLHASSNMHDNIFSKILACPMQFFDTTPVGRIVNRFSADMDEIDVRLPGNMEIFLQNILMIIFALVSISYVSSWFLIALVPLIFFFVMLNKLFAACIRQLKRLDSVTKSPMISHVQASVQGISTIHAYGKSNEFVDKFHNLIDTNTVPYFLFVSSNRWLAIRLDIISACVIFVTGLLVIVNYESMTPALAGMALAFSIQMTGLFQFSIRMAIETEARFTSVERLNHYSREVESEGDSIIKGQRPPDNWPSDGCISFKKYKMKYRDNLPLALKSVSFDVLPQEKVGIVGRSGSEHKDSDLWRAKEKCHIKDTILILDEATAAIDTETDSFVQTTIKEAFSDCTMLIIAHRLNTVLSCNRILVMEDGRVVEYDSPSSLTANPKSKFKMMLDAVESQQGML
ncbi:ABCC5 [Mytilus edulis]|uniref:ATP-binding cassette sub-family C member 5 n=1 Tax=Mytilus edulis TaxID=6550 RepID=A0A8S3RU24_MYTED|nr:ABCC5 [Mytilus edulis]